MKPECLACLRGLSETGFRLSVGGVDYEGVDEGLYQCSFVPEPFRDGDMFKYLCGECADMHEVYMDELGDELDVCQVFNSETGDLCNTKFEGVLSRRSDYVLRVEWGAFHSFCKGPTVTRHKFVAHQEVRVHHDCAVTHWGLGQLCFRAEGMDELWPVPDL